MERVDILVNNAGVTRDMLAVRMRDEDWQAVIDLNLTAGFRLARSALRGMMRRRSGRIVSITSIVGVTGNAGQANYAAAKRSEEHTSELQSLMRISYAVFCLNKTKNTIEPTNVNASTTRTPIDQ